MSNFDVVNSLEHGLIRADEERAIIKALYSELENAFEPLKGVGGDIWDLSQALTLTYLALEHVDRITEQIEDSIKLEKAERLLKELEGNKQS